MLIVLKSCNFGDPESSWWKRVVFSLCSIKYTSKHIDLILTTANSFFIVLFRQQLESILFNSPTLK